MIITTKGGIGTPVNPFPEYLKPPFGNFPPAGNPEWSIFNRDNPPLPVYYNGEQYFGEVKGEAERVWQFYAPNSLHPEWKDCDPNTEWRKEFCENNGCKTREVYVLTSDQITQPGKGNRVPDLNIREFNISFFNEDLIIYDNGSELVEFSKSETIKLRDFLNQLPI